MGTIANAKVTHYYNCYNGDFIGCLPFSIFIGLNDGRGVFSFISVVMTGSINEESRLKYAAVRLAMSAMLIVSPPQI